MKKQYLAFILAVAITVPQVLGTVQVAYASQMPQERVAETSESEEAVAETPEEEATPDNEKSELPETSAADIKQEDTDVQMPDESEGQEIEEQEDTTEQEEMLPNTAEENAKEIKTLEADDGIFQLVLWYGGEWYDLLEDPLPEGVLYTPSNNTLNLKDVNVRDIDYRGSKDLTVCLNNSNVEGTSRLFGSGSLSIEVKDSTVEHFDCRSEQSSTISLKNSNVGRFWCNGEQSSTISLENTTVEQIRHSGTGDLSIVVDGQNQLSTIKMDAGASKGGNLYLKGTGTIESAAFNEDNSYACFLEQEARYYNDSSGWEFCNHGDIYIDDITINISNQTGIISCNSNVTIRNAVLKINSQASGERGCGITTGMADWSGAYRGLLTIKNSEIEIKKCTLGLAWNKINMAGCNLYLGESSPEYKINPATAASYDDYGSFKRGYFENINYLKITKDNLNLPSAYALVNGTASNAGGDISMPEFAVAGKKVNVAVKCNDSYKLSKLYVNGTAISGTSFTMPNKDTTVKAVFVKKAVKVKKVSISGISKKIAPGKKIVLKAAVSPSNATNKAITWKSSNKKYATVNSKGVVTMKKAGKGKTVMITATAKDGSKKKATYKIKCMKGVVKKIKLTAAKSVKAGKKITVKKKVTASKGANTALTYSVNNKKYATVSKKGVVTARKAGKGKTITVTAKATDGSGKKASVKIKIR